ncbi:hypothetical protein ACPC58_08630 [Streptococcus sp. VTCC 12905]
MRPNLFSLHVIQSILSKKRTTLNFFQNIIIGGGSASVTTYDKEILLNAVLKGDINPGRVFTQTYSLDNIDQAYKDMANRKTIKAMVTVE